MVIRRMIMFLILVVMLTALVASGTDTPQQAGTILKAALQKAGAENKTVLLVFHASWCGWCKRLDAVLNNPDIKKIIDEHYVVTHLDVMENGAKKTLENPGGNEMMAEYGGSTSGLPFYVFLSEDGKKIADSNVMPKSQNIGYPGTPEEIAAFHNLLKQTAARMTGDQRAAIVTYLQRNAPR